MKRLTSIIIFSAYLLFSFSCRSKKVCNENILLKDSVISFTYTLNESTGKVQAQFPQFNGLCDSNIQKSHNNLFNEYIIKPFLPDTNNQLVHANITYEVDYKTPELLVISVIKKKQILDAIVPSYNFNKSSYIFQNGTGDIANIKHCIGKGEKFLPQLKVKLKSNNSALDTSLLQLDHVQCIPKDNKVVFYCNLEQVNRLFTITDNINPIAETSFNYSEITSIINENGPLKKITP